MVGVVVVVLILGGVGAGRGREVRFWEGTLDSHPHRRTSPIDVVDTSISLSLSSRGRYSLTAWLPIQIKQAHPQYHALGL